MKSYYFLILIFPLSTTFAALDTTSKITLTSKKKSYLLKSQTPLEIQLRHNINSNLNLQQNTPSEPISSQALSLKTKFKTRLNKKTILINLPQASLEYSPSEAKKIRSINASNTTLGLYFINSKNILSPVLSFFYNQGQSINEDSKLESSNFYASDFELGHTYLANKKLSLTTAVATKFIDYLDPGLDTDDYEKDNISMSIKLSSKYKITRNSFYKLQFKSTQKYFKEQRALNQIGNGEESKSKVNQNNEISQTINFNIQGFIITPSNSYVYNIDPISGGDSYRGPELDLKWSKSFLRRLGFEQRFSYKSREYLNQHQDPFINLQSSVAKLQINTLRFVNTITYQYKKDIFCSLEHSFQKLSSNRIQNEYKAQVFSVGLRINI